MFDMERVETNQVQPHSQFITSTDVDFKSYHNNPSEHSDLGGRRDKAWQDWTLRLFQGLFVVDKVISSSVFFFFFCREPKRPVGWKNILNKTKPAQLPSTIMFKYCDDLDDGEPSTDIHLERPSPIMAFYQVSPGRNFPVGNDIPARNLRSVSIVMI